MYAVVKIASEQVRVAKGERVRVPKLELDEGSRHQFKEVMLVSQDDEVRIGDPLIDGASVEATVVEHGSAQKIVVYKMRRRKKYRRRNGHRQNYTELMVEDIILPDLSVSKQVENHGT